MATQESEFVETPVIRGFTEIAKLFELIDKRGIICGGYARYCASQKVNPRRALDVDIFCYDEVCYGSIRNSLATEGFKIAAESPVAVTYKKHKSIIWSMCPKVQLIKPMNEGAIVATGDMQTILNNFDFTIVRAGILSSTTCLVDIDFHEHDKKTLLVLKNIHCPVSSLCRCLKYAAKGYFLRPFEAMKLFKDWDERSDDYRREIIDLFASSALGELSKEEINQLEALLRID